MIFVCLAMWSIRNLKVHDVSCASATLRLVIITTVNKGLLYSTGGPAERSIIRSIIGTITHAQCLLVDAHSDRPITRPLDSAAGSANAPGLLADAYGTQPINGTLARTVCWMESTGVGWQKRRVSWRRIVRIKNLGISIPLSLLKLLGLRRILIASFTLRVYQCRSWERHWTPSQSGWCWLSQACSATAELSVRRSLTSLLCSVILSFIGRAVSPI